MWVINIYQLRSWKWEIKRISIMTSESNDKNPLRVNISNIVFMRNSCLLQVRTHLVRRAALWDNLFQSSLNICFKRWTCVPSSASTFGMLFRLKYIKKNPVSHKCIVRKGRTFQRSLHHPVGSAGLCLTKISGWGWVGGGWSEERARDTPQGTRPGWRREVPTASLLSSSVRVSK